MLLDIVANRQKGLNKMCDYTGRISRNDALRLKEIIRDLLIFWSLIFK